MNKKVWLILAVAVLVFTTSVITYAYGGKNQKPSDYRIGIAYSDAIKSDKPMLALFYVDWCGYCLKFMPRYKTISTLYKNDYNVVMLNAEDVQYKELVEEVTLAGFPTLYIIDTKYDNRVLLNNAIYQDLKKLRIELDRYIRIRNLLDKSN